MTDRKRLLAGNLFLLAYGKEDEMKKRKWIFLTVLVMMLSLVFGTTVCASGTGDVAGAIEETWKDASGQIKTVVNKVVFPAIDLILAVFFFAKYVKDTEKLFIIGWHNPFFYAII